MTRHPRQRRRLRHSQSLPVVYHREQQHSATEEYDEETLSSCSSSISMISEDYNDDDDDDRPLTFDVDETDSSFSTTEDNNNSRMRSPVVGPLVGLNRGHPCDNDGSMGERLTTTERRSRRRQTDWQTRRHPPPHHHHHHSASGDDVFEENESTGMKDTYDKGIEDATWSVTTSQLLQMVKAVLFTLWVFLSLVTVVYIHHFDGGGTGIVVRDVGRSPLTAFRERGGSSSGTTGGIVDDATERQRVGRTDGGGRGTPYLRAPPLPPLLLRPTAPRNHIPLPLPEKKASVVLMNFSRPRMIQESTLMRTLLSHPNVDEIILLHSNPNTAFRFVHPKVINVDATQQNDEMGLSLRFYFCQMAKNDWVIHVDDDMEFTLGTLSELLIEFARNTRRLVGRFGRNVVEGNSFNGYSSSSTHKSTEVVLTKLMVMERTTCSAFFEYSHLIWEDTILNNGEGPLWNGEDIFMSLVSNHVYGNDGERSNYAMDWLDVWSAPDDLKDYANGKLDISGGLSGYRLWDWHWWQSLLRRNRHYSYRGKLWNTARKRLAESGPFMGEDAALR